MAKIAKGLADEFQSQAQTEVISTEELKFHIEGANRRIQDRIASNGPARDRPRRSNTVPTLQDLDSTIVLSMDVTALFPSISIELASKTMFKAIMNSKIPWEQIDTRQLSRYIAITIPRKP